MVILPMQGLTLPLDTAKVRLQLQTKVFSSDGLGLRHAKPKYRGPFQVRGAHTPAVGDNEVG